MNANLSDLRDLINCNCENVFSGEVTYLISDWSI